MRKLTVFNSITLDGYFTDKDNKIDWAHRRQDEEWTNFISDNARGDGELLFGRKTYDMMKAYWPTPAAAEQMPVVAERMNNARKLVFSRSMTKSDWENTRVVSGDIAEELRRMKDEDGPDMVLMGSGSIIRQLAGASVIDGYQLVITPVVLGAGRTMFEGLDKPIELELTSTRKFNNGNVVMTYAARRWLRALSNLAVRRNVSVRSVDSVIFNFLTTEYTERPEKDP